MLNHHHAKHSRTCQTGSPIVRSKYLQVSALFFEVPLVMDTKAKTSLQLVMPGDFQRTSLLRDFIGRVYLPGGDPSVHKATWLTYLM